MKIVLKGIDSERGSFPKIIEEVEVCIVTKKDGGSYFVDDDKIDCVFINMEEVIDVQLRFKDKDIKQDSTNKKMIDLSNIDTSTEHTAAELSRIIEKMLDETNQSVQSIKNSIDKIY